MKISPEKFKELQEKYKELNLDALIEILTLSGYEKKGLEVTGENSLSLVVDDGTVINIAIDNTLGNYGEFNIESQTASINLSKCGTVADMAMVALHGISHAVLSYEEGIDTPQQEAIIYNTQYLYKNVLLRGGVELSSGCVKNIDLMANAYNSKGTM